MTVTDRRSRNCIRRPRLRTERIIYAARGAGLAFSAPTDSAQARGL